MQDLLARLMIIVHKVAIFTIVFRRGGKGEDFYLSLMTVAPRVLLPSIEDLMTKQ